MALETMYEGLPFSPQTTLTNAISEAETVIPVADVSVFPDAPNYATIAGNDGDGETILYTAKTGSALSGCTRGVEGTAKRWDSGEIISRNWTAKDYESLIANIKLVYNLIPTMLSQLEQSDNCRTVTATQMVRWDSVEDKLDRSIFLTYDSGYKARFTSLENRVSKLENRP